MKINFTETAWGDYIYWQTQDKKTLKRINELIIQKMEIWHKNIFENYKNRMRKNLILLFVNYSDGHKFNCSL